MIKHLKLQTGKFIRELLTGLGHGIIGALTMTFLEYPAIPTFKRPRATFPSSAAPTDDNLFSLVTVTLRRAQSIRRLIRIPSIHFTDIVFSTKGTFQLRYRGVKRSYDFSAMT